MSTHRSPNATKLKFSTPDNPISLKGRVAVISGSTRGIGRECAFALAREGCHIVIAAKSTKSTPELPGDIYSVAKEIDEIGKGNGATGFPFKCDVLDEKSIAACIEATIAKFGRIDICICNASALWWQPIEKTPFKKYDLITRLNTRGSFLLTQACLPHFRKNDNGKGFGRVITMSPPIQLDYTAYKGFTAYNISKFGMTMVAFGAASEYADCNVTGNALWPATVIESQASINFELGDRKMWRKATILADATVAICCDPSKPTGKAFIDDEYLMKCRGLNEEDMKCYRYDPNFEPPRLLADAVHAGEGEDDKKKEVDGFTLQRGDVKKVGSDQKADSMGKTNSKL